jgi:hypothetical protein
MPESLATGAARDLYQICPTAVPATVVFQTGDLDLVAHLAMQMLMLVSNAESVVSLSRKMTAKSEILEIGNVEAHCPLFLNRSARQVREKVAVQEQMTVHE